MYRGCREEYYLVIELIRQFYTEPRGFRITSDMGGYEFIQYSNEKIQPDVMLPDGTIRHKKPIFDIKVTAEKQSPFSRAAQNELVKEFYAMGLFDPANDVAALTCIDALDFEGKDKLKQQIQNNGMMIRQFESAMQFIQTLSLMDPGIAQMAMQQGLINPEMMQPQQGPQAAPNTSGTAEERAARNIAGGDNSQAAKARIRAANAASPM